MHNKQNGQARRRLRRPAPSHSVWLWALAVLVVLAWTVGLGVASLYMARVGYGYELFFSYLNNPALLALNLLPVLILTLFFTFLANRLWVGFLCSGVLVTALSATNYYKLLFRSDPLLATDISYMAEAADMMTNHYALTFSWAVVLTACAVVVVTVVSIFLFRRIYLRRHWLHLSLAIIALAVGGALLVGVYQSDEVYANTSNLEVEFADGTELSVWSDRDNYVCRGFLYPLLHSTAQMQNLKPDGYSRAAAEQILAQYEPADIPDDQKVTVIAVMLEAYSDFTGLGNLELNHDPYTFMHQLAEEGVSGSLLTNIFAGGTIDTERNFIAGTLDMCQYRAPADSYARYFAEQGYFTEFCHPGFDWFYNRRNVAEYLGFEQAWFYEDRYSTPDGQTIINDDVFFPDLISLYEQATADGTPYFNFSVTYQNHGPYVEDYRYDESIEFARRGNLTEGAYNILNNYLWGIDKTDDALRDFVAYFRQEENPVVLVFFGDHKPWLGDGSWVYDELGIDLKRTTEESIYNYYETPYVIWANDAAKATLGQSFSGEGGTFSPYYLMTEVFNQCGWTGDASIQASRDLHEYLDVVNSIGICRENGTIVSSSNISDQAAQALKNYQYIQYYRIRDWR